MNKVKNQHYVPQFYLKNFSNDQNEITVGLLNLKSNHFVRNATIENQSSKKYYYGEDGKIEEMLSNIESILAPKLYEYTKNDQVPKLYSDEHSALLIFAIITDLRNPVHLETLKSFSSLLNNEITNYTDGKNQSNYVPEITHDLAIQLSLDNFDKILKTCSDLSFKILINNTTKPFVTSDFPVIKYNQFLETKAILGSSTGYGAVGIQIFVPLTPSKMIVFYDKSIYKIGNKRERVVSITSDDVDQLNILQLLNCSNNIYFNESVDEVYVKSLLEKCKKSRLSTRAKSSSHKVIKDEKMDEYNQLVHIRSTDIKIGLKISKLNLTRRSSTITSSNGTAPMRSSKF